MAFDTFAAASDLEQAGLDSAQSGGDPEDLELPRFRGRLVFGDSGGFLVRLFEVDRGLVSDG